MTTLLVCFFFRNKNDKRQQQKKKGDRPRHKWGPEAGIACVCMTLSWDMTDL